MIDKQPPTATVTAETETTLLVLERRQLARKLSEDAGFASRFYHAVAIFLADRLRSTVARFGHGDAGPTAEEAEREDELGEDTLDKVFWPGRSSTNC